MENHNPRIQTQRLRVLALPEPPFVFADNNGSYTGYSVSVLDSITKRLGIEYVITGPTDYTGAQSWNGLIHRLAEKEADVAIGPISITSDRRRMVDFTLPYYDFAGLQLVTASSSGSDPQLSAFFFITAMQPDLWLCLALALVATALLVTVFDRLSPFSFRNRVRSRSHVRGLRPQTVEAVGRPSSPSPCEVEPTSEDNETTTDADLAAVKVFTLKESLWCALGSLTQAGETFDPRATSARILVAGFWILSCIVVALYTANLAAVLTVAKMSSSSAGSIRQLTGQTKVKYTVQRNTSGHEFFERMAKIEAQFYAIWRDSIGAAGWSHAIWEYPIHEHYTEMLRRMSGWGFVNSTDEALALVRAGDWAVFMDTPLIRYHVGRECGLRATGEVLSLRPYGIALQKNSPFTSLFNMAILEMQQDRVLEDLKIYWWDRGKVKCPIDGAASGLRLGRIAGVFSLPACGVVLGFLVLLAELAVASLQKRSMHAAQINVEQ